MRKLFLISLLALTAEPASAQFTCQPGLVVDTFPAAPLPGETITVRMRNLGFNTFQIPNDCLFQSVHQVNCGQPPLFTSNCNPGPFTISPGSIFVGAWDQKNNAGALVSPGTYWLKIPIVGKPNCCVPVTISPCPVPASYGQSDAGTGGFSPTLSATGTAKVGQPLQLDIQNGVGGAPSLLFVAFAQTDLVAPFGNLYVDLTPPFLQLVLPLGGAQGAPGQGSFTINAAIPNDAALATLRLYMQAVILDQGSTGFLSHTPGLELFICP